MRERLSNVEFRTMGDLSWEPAQRGESLRRLADYVTAEAAMASDWYLRKKRSSQVLAKTLRFLAAGLIALAGIIPFFAQIFEVPQIPPIWASVALLLAGSCVGLDRLFGYSRSWMRFLITEIQIRRALHDFLFDWELRRANWEGAEDPGAEEAEAVLKDCKAFLAEVNDIIEAETHTWVNESSAAVADIEKTLRTQEK